MLNVDEIQVINDVKKYLGIDMLDIDLQKCDEDGLKVIRSDKHFDVKYNSRSDMFRALGLISLYGDEITEISQKKRTESLAILWIPQETPFRGLKPLRSSLYALLRLDTIACISIART